MERRRRFIALCAAAAAFALLSLTCKLTNKAPSVPTISGPTTGVAGMPVTFTAMAVDTDGDSVAIMFDWGDGATPSWTALVASGDTVTATNTYADSGVFTIRAKAKDKSGKESDWSAGHVLSLISASPTYPDSVVGEMPLPWPCLRSGLSPDGNLMCVGPSYAPAESLILIRTSDRTVMSHIRAGSNIGAVAFSSDNQLLFVGCGSNGRVYRVGVSQGSVTDSTSVVRAPHTLLVSPDNSRIYASIRMESKVLVLRADDLVQQDSIVFDSYVEGMAMSRTGTTLYVCTANGIGIVDAARCSLRLFSATPSWTAQPILSPDEHLLYVRSDADSGLEVLNATDLTIVDRMNLHISGGGDLSISPDGAYLYFGLGIGLYAFDTRTMAAVDSIALQLGGSIMPHPNGDSLYCQGGRKLYVLAKRP